MVTIKVPATTANLGPGFDSLGLAFELYSYFSFTLIESGIKIIGCDSEFQNEENLVYKAFKKTAEKLNVTFKGIQIEIESEIPVSRGLGSSAACIVGGVMGANFIFGNPLSKEEIFEICTSLEGHPDNVAPAIFGGLTASFIDNEKPYTTHYNISKDIFFYIFIPNFRLSTTEARAVLPKYILHKDAVFNISRVAVLLKALENSSDSLIKKSLKDNIHEQYRKNLIPEFENVKNICEANNNLGFFISGAGPALINISKDFNLIKKIDDNIKKLKNNWQLYMLNVDYNGAQLV